MADVDRNSFTDAQKYISSLLSIHGSVEQIAYFLSEKIKLANEINPHNWNLNLALNGKFLRFNVGQEYCIQIYEHEILILCLKGTIPIEVQKEKNDLYFRGYKKGSEVINTHAFNETPQCLAKVPDSIGIVFNKNITNWISLITESNSQFIEHAITKTKILPQMIGAHSVGAIEYLSAIIGNKLPNPSFAFDAIVDNEERALRKLKKLSNGKLSELAQAYNSSPHKAETTTSVFIRNPYIVEQAKRLANGKCQDCGQPAPFLNKSTNEPFLEIHHIVPLSQGGEDVIENVLALCPNCHRKRHYG